MANLQRSKRKKAYSLLELIVSLAIIAVATVVMVNFLVLSLRISITTLGRSFVREEVSNLVLLMARDIRNAEVVTSISCPQVDQANPMAAGCEIAFTRSGRRYKWRSCTDNGTNFRICKDIFDTTTGQYQETYRSSNSVDIDYFNIVYGYSESFISNRINIILTVAASHTRNDLAVNDVIRQASFSTRNYEY